jgi:uncharacterized protein (TIGR02594 family)
MQTTGRFNYRQTGKDCGVPFEEHPELIVSAEHALKPALIEWSRGKLNGFADKDDVLSISRAINIGNPNSKKTPNGLQDRKMWLAKVMPLIDSVEFAAGVVSQPQPTVSAIPPAVPSMTSTASIAALVGEDLLRQGDQGARIRAIQLALKELGYNLKGTGFFGGATDTAVSNFQRVHNIEVDGVVGPQTAEAIDKALFGREPGGGAPDKRESAVSVGVAGVSLSRNDNARPLWLLEGLNWLGTEEVLGEDNNPVILKWARDQGGTIAREYRRDSIAWCALFANIVLTKVGLKGTNTLWALDWAVWGQKLGGVAVGAFAPMKRSGGGHIAIVVGRDQHGNLMCLGGNQSDRVSIVPFPAGRPLSFRWPHGAALPANVGFDSLPLVRSNGKVSSQEA